jgi:hypothetical protein
MDTTKETVTNAIRALSAVLDGKPLEEPVHGGTQMERVFEALFDGSGDFVKLGTIALRAGCSTASASARIRDLRNLRGFIIDRRPSCDGGSHEYRLA